MKEFKTLRVYPEEESKMRTFMDLRNWTLDNRQEVYNKTEKIVGMRAEQQSYGAFWQGYTGKDGRVDTKVETKEEVTHFISMTFSREQDTPQHERIVQLENSIDTFAPKPREELKSKGYFAEVFLLILGGAIAIGSKVTGGIIVGAILLAIAVIDIFTIPSRKRKIEEENRKASAKNNALDKTEKENMKKWNEELARLLKEEKEFLARK